MGLSDKILDQPKWLKIRTLVSPEIMLSKGEYIGSADQKCTTRRPSTSSWRRRPPRRLLQKSQHSLKRKLEGQRMAELVWFQQRKPSTITQLLTLLQKEHPRTSSQSIRDL